MANPAIIRFITLAFLLTSMNIKGIKSTLAATTAAAGDVIEYVPVSEVVPVEHFYRGMNFSPKGDPAKTCSPCQCCADKDRSRCKQMPQCCYALTCKGGVCSMVPISCNCNGCQ